jgi:hypothetical protein
MGKLMATVLILLGCCLVYIGFQDADTIGGRTRTTLAELKSDIDGKRRTPKQYYYYAGGGVLVLAGAGFLLRRGS